MNASPILVVIPTLNEADTIDAVLESLSRGLPADRLVRFVVVDGGSTDATIERVRERTNVQPDLHLLRNPQRLQSAAVNLAVAVLGEDADVLVRCDAHAAYPDGYVAALIASLDRHQADAVVVPMDSIGDTCMQRAIAWVSDSLVGSGGSDHRGGRRSGFVPHGHHAAFRLASFRRAGGYDATFSHNEDAELDCRQVAIGSRIYLDADIRIGYYPRSNLRDLWRQYFRYGRGRSRTVQKHPHSIALRQLVVPSHVGLTVLSIAGSLRFPALLAYPALYAALLGATSLLVAVRHRSLCGLGAGAAALTMHVGWGAGFLAGMLTQREQRWKLPASIGASLRSTSEVR